MNVTPGWKASPVFREILRRWPSPQILADADIAELTDLLYPLGLFNQRAASLVRMSKEYVEWGWPVVAAAVQAPRVLADARRQEPLKQAEEELVQEVKRWDVKPFYGAGRYASDSFRIYSDLCPGGGGPSKEAHWLAKRTRALRRMGDANELRTAEAEGEEDLGECLSDEEGDDSHEEWRTVLANGGWSFTGLRRLRCSDKELKRYLVRLRFSVVAPRLSLYCSPA